MPDITMCSPERILKICAKCYRRNAMPTYRWQSYSRFTPKNDQECENFMKDDD